MGMIGQRHRPAGLTNAQQQHLKRSKSGHGTNRLLVIASGLFCVGAFTLFPILVLESSSRDHNSTAKQQAQIVPRASVDHAVRSATTGRTVPKQQQRPDVSSSSSSSAAVVNADGVVGRREGAVAQQVVVDATTTSGYSGSNNGGAKTATQRTTKDGRVLPVLTLADLVADDDNQASKSSVLGRGVAAVMNPSPWLQPARRAHVEDCDINVDSLAYWNVGETPPVDNPFHSEGYISFAPDRGGWNNVRMSMEIIFVIAAATGRTLVLPPREPMYLLQLDKTGSRYRGFADFFPIHTAAFQSRVKVITFEDFLATSGLAPTDDEELMQKLTAAADHCDQRAKSESSCKPVFEWMKNASYNSEISATHTCLVFDEEAYCIEDAAAVAAAAESLSADHNNNNNSTALEKKRKEMEEVCGTHREITFWNAAEMGAHPWIHFRASENEYRLLTHFYNIIHFSNPMYDNMYKRFVRDALHYHDSIYCAAGKIVKAIQWEGRRRGQSPDADGAGGYSALHVRRGDLQYKKVKIPASEWYENTKEVWRPNEILYVATDERNKTFFDDLQKHHDLRFLDDYWDLAGLSDLDPNYMGMIDTVVASRGRAFAGTWFSTFSGYINRLRGYHGLSMMDSWYSFLEKKTAVHEWKTVDDFAYAFEWPDGWVGIDGDEFPSRDKF